MPPHLERSIGEAQSERKAGVWPPLASAGSASTLRRAGRGQGHPHASAPRAQPRRDPRQSTTPRTTSGCCRPRSRL